MFSRIVACVYNFCKGPKPAHRRGLTIMEVAIASALLFCAMPAVLNALSNVYSYSLKIERKTQSLVFAQGKLDERRARSIYNFGSAGSLNQSDVSMYPGSSYYCNVTDVNAGSNLRTLTVTAGYDEDGDKSLDDGEVIVTLATYIARRW